MGVFAADWKFYIFGVSTGKLLRVADESLDQYKEALERNELAVDTFHFNKKMKTELLIQEKAKNEGLDSPINCVFDRSDKFVVFGSWRRARRRW
ncbi:hypothetical protein BLSTO_06385 [Blastocystis sp. subtype 1]